MKPTTRFERLFGIYCDRKFKTRDEVRFQRSSDNTVIEDSQTPQQLHMMSGVTIEASVLCSDTERNQ